MSPWQTAQHIFVALAGLYVLVGWGEIFITLNGYIILTTISSLTTQKVMLNSILYSDIHWRNTYHCHYRKFEIWKLFVQPATTISSIFVSKWYIRLSEDSGIESILQGRYQSSCSMLVIKRHRNRLISHCYTFAHNKLFVLSYYHDKKNNFHLLYK